MPLYTPEQISITDYHQSVTAGWLSKTSIRDFCEHGPAWWKMAYLDKTISKPTPDGAVQGLALDCLLTEGTDAYLRGFSVKPEGFDGRTKEGKEWVKAQAGRRIISHQDSLILVDAAAAVRGHPRWKEIEACRAQMTCRRKSDALGLGLQSRPDWLNTDKGALFDLKKTCDLSGFGRQAINLGYHLQAAIAGWCLAGDSIALESACLVAVEWERGARCRFYEIPHYALESGDHQMRETAAEIARRIKDNDWSDVQAGTEDLEIPDWMARKMQEAA
jgi:hypothetical protein